MGEGEASYSMPAPLPMPSVNASHAALSRLLMIIPVPACWRRIPIRQQTDGDFSHVPGHPGHSRETHDVETQKLKFDRVDMSTKMKNIVDKLKPLCAKLTAILDTELLGSANFRLEQFGTNPLLAKSSYTTHGSAMNRATTSPEIIEKRLYGRGHLKENIVNGIIKGEYSTNQLTVLPIVGPGGIGKTTLTQQICQRSEELF